jgi:hypothetical protein
MSSVDGSKSGSPATSTATGGKENVSTSVPPATMPENSPEHRSDPSAMQKETRRHSEQVRKEEDERGQP